MENLYLNFNRKAPVCPSSQFTSRPISLPSRILQNEIHTFFPYHHSLPLEFSTPTPSPSPPPPPPFLKEASPSSLVPFHKLHPGCSNSSIPPPLPSHPAPSLLPDRPPAPPVPHRLQRDSSARDQEGRAAKHASKLFG